MSVPKYIDPIRATADPVILRARYVGQIVDSVNFLTTRFRQPRDVNEEANKIGQRINDVATGVTRYSAESTNSANYAYPETTLDLFKRFLRGEITNETIAAAIDFLEDQLEQQFGEIWTEFTRASETVRITNPEDAEDYVDVARPTSITFTRPDGTKLTLTFAT